MEETMEESSEKMRTTRDDLFLGTGWTFPPTFSRESYSVEMARGEVDVREALWVLFSTAMGERIMLPTFGTALWDMVFRNVDTRFKTELEDAVRQAVLNWEPRIDVESIEVTEDPTVPGLVNILVSYVIRRTNARGNLVYPFYLQEGTLAPAPPER
jgi:phage baseplate assembly protein W